MKLSFVHQMSVIAAIVVVGTIDAACKMPSAKTIQDVADIVLTVAEVSCALEHEAVQSEALIATACQIEQSKAPAIRALLSSGSVKQLIAAKHTLAAKQDACGK